jgi:hypothetical protein
MEWWGLGHEQEGKSSEGVIYIGTMHLNGWPLPAIRWGKQFFKTKPAWNRGNELYDIWLVFGFIDLAVALLILFSVWYACEWLIRRRALKKGQ